MESKYIYSRTTNSWRLTFVHAAKFVHFLTRALLMTTASAGIGLAGLCCWIDRFRSSKENSWMMPMSPKHIRSSKGASWMMPMSPKGATNADRLEIPRNAFRDRIAASPKLAMNEDYLDEPDIPRNVFGDKISASKRATNKDYADDLDIPRNVFGDRLPRSQVRF